MIVLPFLKFLSLPERWLIIGVLWQAFRLFSGCPHIYIKRASNSIILNNEELLERITINSKIMVGKPVIRSTRLTMECILGLLAHGINMEAILEEYPGLVKDDVYACLLFASKTLQDASFVPAGDKAI